MSFKEKLKAPMEKLDDAIRKMEKQFGSGAVMRMDGDNAVAIPCVSSGSLAIDIALKTGGYPKGRIIEIYGPESSGKTTLTLHAIAQAQRAGGVCAFVDAEHALDISYAAKLGVNLENLLVSQPDYGEQALDITLALLQTGMVGLVVVDSVAALTPKAELEGNIGDHHVGSQARMMSQAMRMLTVTANRTQSTVLFINQTRQKIGVMFGNPETTTGGNALKFFASVRIDIRRKSPIKTPKSDDPIGNRTKVKITKNKLAPPFRIAEFDIIFGRGICRFNELIEQGETTGIIQRAGTWFSYGDKKLGQGKENAAAFLMENPQVAAAIDAAIRQHAGLQSPAGHGTKDEEDAA